MPNFETPFRSEEEKEFSIEKNLEKIERTIEELPEVQREKDLWQNNFHEFDVYDHTTQFVRHLKNILEKEGKKIDPDLVVAGWLHDVGKPVVAEPKEKDGVIEEREPGKTYHSFTDHEIIGERMVREMDSSVFEKLGLDQEKVASLVYCHYLPMKGIKEMRKADSRADFLQKYKTLKKGLEEPNEPGDRKKPLKEEILLMFLADKLAQGDPNKYVTDQEELFSIREALLSEDSEEEENKLKEIYEIQKKEAENDKRYGIKE